MIRFTVPAVPVAQPRPKVVTIAGRGMAVSNPRKHPVTDFKASVREAAQRAYQGGTLSDPLRVRLLFVMPRPNRLRWKRRPMPRCWHDVKPDAENLVKAVLDALSKTVWVDDSLVVHLDVQKVHAAGDEQPHVLVEIETLGPTV